MLNGLWFIVIFVESFIFWVLYFCLFWKSIKNGALELNNLTLKDVLYCLIPCVRLYEMCLFVSGWGKSVESWLSELFPVEQLLWQHCTANLFGSKALQVAATHRKSSFDKLSHSFCVPMKCSNTDDVILLEIEQIVNEWMRHLLSLSCTKMTNITDITDKEFWWTSFILWSTSSKRLLYC